MHIDITGHHLDLTDALRNYVQDKIGRLERHFEHVNNIHVILEVEKLQHKAEAIMQVSGGAGSIHADSVKDDMYAAIDSLVDKLDRQVLKYKEKLTDHHKKEKVAFGK